ncbi:MAG: transcriptional regulator [Microbacterium sp.]|nr:transcriptional regulator [Microbacterium sp.]
MSAPRSRLALVDEAYAALGEAIVDGRLRPGDRLRDVELAAYMGISRTPVREALQKLQRIGLVEVAANRYTRVAALTDRARTDMREYAAHNIASAMRVALPRCTPEEIETALTLIDAMRDADSSKTYVAAVLDLYALMVAASHNIPFQRTLEQTERGAMAHIDLRELTADDRDAAFAAVRDSASSWPRATIENREAFDAWVAEDRVAARAVVADGAIVGLAATLDVDDDREILLAVTPDAVEGVATEALRLLTVLEPERPLYACLAADDDPSHAVLAGLGFVEDSRDGDDIVYVLPPTLE